MFQPLIFSLPPSIPFPGAAEELAEWGHVGVGARATSGVSIQVASGAYAPPVSKIHNIVGM